MTQAQYQWLQDNGYDPTVYDVDPRGRVIKSPVAPEPIQQVGDALCSGDDADKPVGVQHPCSKHGEHQYIFAYKLYTQFS